MVGLSWVTPILPKLSSQFVSALCGKYVMFIRPSKVLSVTHVRGRVFRADLIMISLC